MKPIVAVRHISIILKYRKKHHRRFHMFTTSYHLYPYITKEIREETPRDPYHLLSVLDPSKHYNFYSTELLDRNQGLYTFSAEKWVSERLYQVRVHESSSDCAKIQNIALVFLVNTHLNDKLSLEPGDDLISATLWNLEECTDFGLYMADADANKEFYPNEEITTVSLAEVIRQNIEKCKTPEYARKVFTEHMLVFENHRLDMEWDRTKGIQTVYVDFLHVPTTGYDAKITERTEFHDYMCVYAKYNTRV